MEEYNTDRELESNESEAGVPILRGCDKKECICTGKCFEVVGHIEDLSNLF